MRPDYLNPFFASLVSIKGVGAKVLKVFARLLRGDPQADVRRIDLLLHMPVSYVDRSLKEDIADIPDGTIVSLRVFVDRHIPSSPRYKRVPYRIETHLEDGESVLLTYFFVRGNYLSKQIPEDSVRYVSGRLERYQGKAQIAHPDYVVSEAEFDGLPMVEPIYPLTAGLSNKQLHKVILACLEDLVPLRNGWILPCCGVRDGCLLLIPFLCCTSLKTWPILKIVLRVGGGWPMMNALQANWLWLWCGAMSRRAKGLLARLKAV